MDENKSINQNHPRTSLEGLRNMIRNLSHDCKYPSMWNHCYIHNMLYVYKISLQYMFPSISKVLYTNWLHSISFIYLWLYIYYRRTCHYQNHELSSQGLHVAHHLTSLSETSMFCEHKIIFKPYNKYMVSLVWFLWTQQLSWAVLAFYVIKLLCLRIFCILWWVKKQTSYKILLH